MSSDINETNHKPLPLPFSLMPQILLTSLFLSLFLVVSNQLLVSDQVNAKATDLRGYVDVSQKDFEVTKSVLVKDVLYSCQDIIFYCLCMLFLWMRCFLHILMAMMLCIMAKFSLLTDIEVRNIIA